MKKTAQNKVAHASAVLRQVAESIAAGATISDAIRCASISEEVFRHWLAQYGCFELDQIDRIKEMEAENGMLQKTAHDLSRRMLRTEPGEAGPSRPRAGLMRRLEIPDGVVSIDRSEAGVTDGAKTAQGIPQDLVKYLESLRMENHRLRQTVANLTLQKLIRGIAVQD